MNPDIVWNKFLGYIKRDKMDQVSFEFFSKIKVEPLKSPLGKIFYMKFKYKSKSKEV